MEHPSIMGIGTAVPAHCLEQGDVSLRLKEALRQHPDAARWANRIFAHCGVDSRYTCEPNLLEPADRCRYLPSTQDTEIPTTAERMRIFQRESVRLAAEAARKALDDSGVNSGEITHVIAVSCTGMFLPGLDTELIGQLDLSADVHRMPVTFMGCAAGLTAIRISTDIVRREPAARVLVVTVELCTLHIQPSFEKEDLFSAAFFGDGASACVVGMSETWQKGMFDLYEACAELLPNTGDKMVWTVGDYGFRLHLSPEIPKLIESSVPSAFNRFRRGGDLPALWAIHPGGRGIIDALQAVFRLPDRQTEASRSVLRKFGNMSSATILFVLDELRQEQRTSSAEGMQEGIAMAFGPGITVEMLRFAYRPR